MAGPRRVVASIAYRRHVRPDDLADLQQEVRLAIWKAGRDRQVNATWIFKVVASRVLDHLRHEARTKRARITGSQHQSSNPADDAELSHLLRARLSTLSNDLQRYYYLRYRCGMTEREVGLKTGNTRSTVRHWERRLKGQLARPA